MQHEGHYSPIPIAPMLKMIYAWRIQSQNREKDPELKKNAPVVLLLTEGQETQERDYSPLNDIQCETKSLSIFGKRQEENGIPYQSCEAYTICYYCNHKKPGFDEAGLLLVMVMT